MHVSRVYFYQGRALGTAIGGDNSMTDVNNADTAEEIKTALQLRAAKIDRRISRFKKLENMTGAPEPFKTYIRNKFSKFLEENKYTDEEVWAAKLRVNTLGDTPLSGAARGLIALLQTELATVKSQHLQAAKEAAAWATECNALHADMAQALATVTRLDEENAALLRKYRGLQVQLTEERDRAPLPISDVDKLANAVQTLSSGLLLRKKHEWLLRNVVVTARSGASGHIVNVTMSDSRAACNLESFLGRDIPFIGVE